MKIACGWLYILNQYGYPPSFEDTLKGISKAAEWGFEAFEMEGIGEDNLKMLYERRRELRDHIDSLGLTLVNFCPMLPDMVSLEESKRTHALGLFELGCDLGLYLNSELIMIDSYEVPLSYVGDSPGEDPIHYGGRFRVRVVQDFSWERVWENLVSVVSLCAELTARRGIRLAMELRVGETVSNTDAFLRLYEAVDNPKFGAVFDTAHLNAQKEILPLGVEKLKQRIFLIHASDNDGRMNEHLALRDGNIDWVALFRTLRKHHYDGYVALDIGDCPNLEGAYLRSKQFLETLEI